MGGRPVPGFSAWFIVVTTTPSGLVIFDVPLVGELAMGCGDTKGKGEENAWDTVVDLAADVVVSGAQWMPHPKIIHA
jgi:hypothetical protein